ncbi:unnamed protein product [Leptidea sinapis]|uniref:protein xylosyltransferase n=1 Tax=Leptidea sinapis TaxID=189913 RepID=A0A5E4PNL6_9NEOP|nr:unnamed protein product [Leptidea sinapis]
MMALTIRKLFYRYAKLLIIIVLAIFFAQLIVSIIYFPSIHDNLLRRSGYTSSLSIDISDVSARKGGQIFGDDEESSKNHAQKLAMTLRLEELDFVPMCDITNKEAISAIHRAKTQYCKQVLVNKTCQIVEGHFYPKQLTNKCRSNIRKYGKHLGCHLDEKKLRLLSSFYGNYATTNTPTFCLDICLQAGLPYAGVQYGTECFCGDIAPPSNAKISEKSCDMKCPGDQNQVCGGYFTMNVYETGLDKFLPQTPITGEKGDNSVRIVFLLTLNGRAIRQVHRLINALYRTKHYFYIHVDKRQNYMHRKLLKLQRNFNNIRLAPLRYSTIWGGASLLQMLLSCMRDFFELGWQWDYVINLSESDFPIKSLEELETFLYHNKGLNFVKSHGREVQRFIKKQGLDKTFVECETHMWRIGERKLPRGITIDGGSDWVALSPEFVSYVTGDKDELLRGLDVVFEHTLLPAESYFHTVLRNSKFCNTYVDNNLHVTNWKRKLGCKCQYKHVVDWCGCSPNDFKTEDWPKIQNTINRQLFFARKFEPIINQEIITRVEQLIGIDDHYLIKNLEAYWQNVYDIEDLTASTDDTILTHASSILRHSSKILASEDCQILLGDIIEVNNYKYADVYKGNLILHKVALNNNLEVVLETWYKSNNVIELSSDKPYLDFIQKFKVSSEYDQKEMTFRNLGDILGPFSEPILLYEFSAFKASGNLSVLWLDPAGVLADVNVISRDENNLTNFIKPTIKNPLLPGVWKVALFDQSELLAVTKFLITPLEFYSNKEITHQEVNLIHSGSQNSYKNFTHTKGKNFLPSREQMLHYSEISHSNTMRTGDDLREWIDSMSPEFYTILGTCVVASSNQLNDKVVCGKYKFEFCELSEWSSKSPDPKGTLGTLDKGNGRLKRI